MKKTQKRTFFARMALIAIIGIALISCSDGGGNPPPPTFTVTFHANGGTPEPAQQTIEKGTTATEPPAMTKTNSDFDGWYKESGFTTKWNFATDTVIANVDLHAKWETYYGALPNGIKIYKGDASITDQQMAAAVTQIKNQFENLTQQEKTAVNNTLTKIRIISDKDYTWDGHILGMKFDKGGEDLLGVLQFIASGEMPILE